MASRRYRRQDQAEQELLTPQERRRRLRVLARLVPMLAPYRGRFVVATALLLVGSGLTLVYPQAVRTAIDTGVSQATSTGELDRLALAVGLVFVVNAAVTWGRHYLMSWLGERVVVDLRARVYQRLIAQPIGYFHEKPSGELTGRLAADTATIQGIVGSELSIALRDVVTLLGGLVLLLIENWRLTLWMLAIVPPLLVISFVFGRRIQKMSGDVQDKLAESSAHVQETVGAIATVQAFSREPVEAQRYGVRVREFFGSAVRLSSWRGLFIATMSLAGWWASAVMLWLGGRQIIAGTLTAGELSAFLIYTLMVAFALGGLAGLWGSLQTAAGATLRLFEILDRVPEIADPASPLPLPARDASSTLQPSAVRFDHVTFAYPARKDMPVLHDVTFEVAHGETVALVGRSGAGKSTIANLIYRFFDVDAGAVLVDGVDVRKARLAELRGRLAIVAQEPALFSGTIAENIAYARPELVDGAANGAVDAEVERAARLAHAHEFIERFPDGYRTRIGERGVKLSGGQRQRVAIARALLADPRVLILDEATSSLDAESEALVQDALSTLMRGRTTLVIAHRLSTVKDATRILVLDQGRIVDAGRHDELAHRPGVYHTLIQHQLAS